MNNSKMIYTVIASLMEDDFNICSFSDKNRAYDFSYELHEICELQDNEFEDKVQKEFTIPYCENHPREPKPVKPAYPERLLELNHSGDIGIEFKDLQKKHIANCDSFKHNLNIHNMLDRQWVHRFDFYKDEWKEYNLIIPARLKLANSFYSKLSLSSRHKFIVVEQELFE